MVESLGLDALLSIIANLFFIGLSWWALQAIQLERFLKPNRVMQARALYIILSITIGSTVGNFFLSYLHWSRQLPLML